MVELYIDGANSAGSKQSERLNPVSGKVATQFSAASSADARLATAAAERAFAAWSKTGPGERRTILNKAATELEARRDAIIEAMVSETGSTTMWAGVNVTFGAEMFREAAAMTTQITGETIPSNRVGTTALGVRGPVGPMLGIAPWNAPVILCARAVAMPLACGNTVVLKGAERCPQTHRFVVDALIAAGCPKGAINYINCDPADGPEIVETLVTAPEIKRINFTGSSKVGKIIAGMAAADLKPVLLELGGKAPMVILSDAEIENTVRSAVFGAFFNQGQICMSTERIIVDEAIADEFVGAFVERAKSLSSGDPNSEDTPLGAVVDPSTGAHLERLLTDAEAKGASVLLKGKTDGVLMGPTIVDGVDETMALWHDESFGPIVAVRRASGDAELIRLANNTDYGLSAAVYGSDMGRLMDAAGAIESGMCHINGPTVYDEPQMPFGGVKASGYGRFGGRFGLESFTEVKWITINTKPIHLPI